jgi:hypothetical protein
VLHEPLASVTAMDAGNAMITPLFQIGGWK